MDHKSDTLGCANTTGVVLADHHAMFREGLASLLEQQSNIKLLDQVDDGESAWRAIQTRGPDIAILDLALPDASGMEVARRADAAALDTRCLVLATQEDPDLASRVLQGGAVGYVLKTNSFEELMRALRCVIAGGTFVSPSIAGMLRTRRRSGHRTALLSPREQEVIRLLSTGKSSKEIGCSLGISPQTVDTHRQRLMRKLGLGSSIEVVRYAAQSGLLV